MGKIKAFVPRSRLGCVSCKKRRVKCDETHPKCLKCQRLQLDCKYENMLRWEDDARQRGVTFGRSYEARMRKQKAHPKDQQFQGKDESLEHDLTSFVDITTKRGTYLFVTSTFEDFSNIYDMQDKEKQDGLGKKKGTTGRVEIKGEYTRNSIKEPPTNNSLASRRPSSGCLLKRITAGDFVDLDSLVLDASIVRRSSGDKMVPFLSNSIPKIFSSPKTHFIADNTSQRAALKIDDIFLQSFSSPHLSQLSSPSLHLDELLTFESFIPALTLSEQSLTFQPVMTPLERSLLTYFIESICPYCVCYPMVKRGGLNHASDTMSGKTVPPESNPYLHLIVPLALRSGLVLKAVVASSAKQLALLGLTQFEETAKNYSYQVLQELPKVIVRKEAENETDWDDILATMIMLCFTEISASCSSSWLVHLNGAKQYLKNSCIQNNLSPIGKFFVRYFISHEVMAETAWVYDSHQRCLRPVNDDLCIEALKSDDDIKIDLVLGCSPYLISLVHRISVLGKCFEDLEMETPAEREGLEREIVNQAVVLEQSLTHLTQQLPLMEEDDESALHIETIAEIKKLAALIYLFARIQLEIQFYHKDTANITPALKKVKGYIKRIMQLHSTLPGCYVSLLWPIFIIGIVCTDEEERWFVIDSMTQMQKHRELSSVKSAKDVVLSVWREKDLCDRMVRWKDMIKGKAATISLA